MTLEFLSINLHHQLAKIKAKALCQSNRNLSPIGAIGAVAASLQVMGNCHSAMAADLLYLWRPGGAAELHLGKGLLTTHFPPVKQRLSMRRKCIRIA